MGLISICSFEAKKHYVFCNVSFCESAYVCLCVSWSQNVFLETYIVLGTTIEAILPGVMSAYGITTMQDSVTKLYGRVVEGRIMAQWLTRSSWVHRTFLCRVCKSIHCLLDRLICSVDMFYVKKTQLPEFPLHLYAHKDTVSERYKSTQTLQIFVLETFTASRIVGDTF